MQRAAEQTALYCLWYKKKNKHMHNLHIAVIGAGQMGSGIAAVFAAHGYRVTLVDAVQRALTSAKDRITAYLSKVSVESDMISFHSDLNVLATADIVIEAIPENLDLKHSLYTKLNTIVRSDTMIATNTSSFPISDLAKSVANPERFIGIHFMNPVLKMDLVEIIPGSLTNEHTLATGKTLITTIKKTAVISTDRPGFIVNRLLIPMINQAFMALEEGLASKEDIDTAMEKGAAFPMGPLKLADFIGLDTCLAIMETLCDAFPNDGYTPSSLLKTYVNQGTLGRKTKQGVYSY
ncbi:MAG: 3-hydroxyacyl-CoA dehydrogenase family protein [Alphaproteobacteria bacterium]|nr:3-hydroxyacyl-CoA dehydrogenase family protein [Alphaproteobacteria bacterium]